MEVKDGAIAPDYWEDRDWAWGHYVDFVQQYPDQWIAIVFQILNCICFDRVDKLCRSTTCAIIFLKNYIWHKNVVAHGKSLNEIEAITREKTGVTHFPVLFVEGHIHVYAN